MIPRCMSPVHMQSSFVFDFAYSRIRFRVSAHRLRVTRAFGTWRTYLHEFKPNVAGIHSGVPDAWASGMWCETIWSVKRTPASRWQRQQQRRRGCSNGGNDDDDGRRRRRRQAGRPPRHSSTRRRRPISAFAPSPADAGGKSGERPEVHAAPPATPQT